MSKHEPLLGEKELLESELFQQYLEARTEIMRLAPFIQMTPECRTYEQLYQRYISPRLSQA